MKKIIRLTESDITRIVKRVIREQATNIPLGSPQKSPAPKTKTTIPQKPSNSPQAPQGFNFPFPLSLYKPHKSGDPNKAEYVTQVQVQSIDFQGTEFLINAKIPNGGKAIFTVACDNPDILPVSSPPDTIPMNENFINGNFTKDFQKFYCTYSQYGKGRVPSAPGGYSAAPSANKYTSMS